MKIQISILIVLISIAITFSACVKVDAPVDIPSTTTYLSAKINGEDFSVSGIQVTAEFTIQYDTIQTLAIGGVMLPINGVTKAIALAAVSANSAGINSGDIFTATSNTKIAAGEYSFDNNTYNIKALSSNTDVANIVITKIDFDNKVVSGTFSFNGSDDDDLNTIYEIRDGVFTDVSFK